MMIWWVKLWEIFGNLGLSRPSELLPKSMHFMMASIWRLKVGSAQKLHCFILQIPISSVSIIVYLINEKKKIGEL